MHNVRRDMRAGVNSTKRYGAGRYFLQIALLALLAMERFLQARVDTAITVDDDDDADGIDMFSYQLLPLTGADVKLYR